LDSNVDILLRGLMYCYNGLLVVGVDGLEGLAFDTFYELIVNEPGTL
jgi:hypothetical protein